MTNIDLSKALWDLANSITAFSAIQGLVFSYACAKKETGDILNKKRLKAAIAIIIVAITLLQSLIIEWSRNAQCGLDADHCQLHTEASIGRIFCIVGVGVCGILILYARQLFSKQPFDA